jgi:hypothetical protein
MEANEARVNVTYSGSNGDLPDPVSFDAADEDVKTWIAEALRGGGIPGITVNGAVDLTDFVVDRFAATDVRPYALIQLRPKTPFGSSSGHLGPIYDGRRCVKAWCL